MRRSKQVDPSLSPFQKEDEKKRKGRRSRSDVVWIWIREKRTMMIIQGTDGQTGRSTKTVKEAEK